MDTKPLTSVVIPTYNRAQATIAAVESVLTQTYRPLEILVVDDGSTDESADIIAQFVRTRSGGDADIVFFRQHNQGPSGARNAGIARARGEYIAFLDSDDRWAPAKLDLQMNVLCRFSECGACFTDTRCVNGAGGSESAFRQFGAQSTQRVGIERDATRLLARSFCGFFVSSLIATSELVRRVGGFDPEVSFAEDRDFYFRLSLSTSLAYVDEQLVCADRRPSPVDSSCRPWDHAEVRLRGHQRMYEKWLRLGGVLTPEVRRIILDNLRATHCDWANWHLENKRYSQARREVTRAIRYSISPKMTAKWVLTWTAPGVAARVSGKPGTYL
jgi:glycosyltransferase involved in cell wall biosynthesis